MPRKDTIQVSLRLSRRMHRLAMANAEDLGISMNAWMILAVAARIKNWRDYGTGKKTGPEHAEKGKYDGWFCEHGTHSDIIPAAECPHKNSVNHRKSWVMVGMTMGYDAWLKEKEGQND